MTGGWLISYMALWVLVSVLSAFLVGALREIAILRPVLRGRESLSQFNVLNRIDDGPPLGSSLPVLALESANGHGTFSLPSLLDAGNLLVVFLGSLCPSCHDLVDGLNTAADARLDLRVVVVLEGTESASRGFIEVFKINGPVALDPLGQISSHFNSHHVPYGFLYGGNGTLVNKGTIASEAEIAVLLGNGDGPGSLPRGAGKEAHRSNSRAADARAS